MSRVIKFRAWNGDAMEYGGFYIHATGKIRPETNLTRVKEGSHVMQFTGLHDRNGKEIYESDIVKVYFTDYFSNECFTVDDGDVETIFKMKFVDGGWTLETSDGCRAWAYDPCLLDYDIEVIGNIHENPELMEG